MKHSAHMQLAAARQPRASAPGQRRCGVVLIVVLVLVVMVALAGFGFLAGMSTEYEAARLHGSLLQAQQTLASAESELAWFAGLTERERQLLGGSQHNPLLFRSRLVLPLTAAGSAASSASSVTSPLGSDAAGPAAAASQSSAATPLADGSAVDGTTVDARWRFSMVSVDHTAEQGPVLRFGLQNMSARLHLASVWRWEQATPGQGRQALLQLPGMTEEIADAILDWIDPDDVAREFGAESEYYQTLDRPYRAANALPAHLSELLYVRGVTRGHLRGAGFSGQSAFAADAVTASGSLPQPTTELGAAGLDSAGAGAMGDIAATAAAPGGVTGPGWEQLLTLHAAERNRSRRGAPRVFLNNSSLAALEQQLTGRLPDNLLRYILLARAYGVQFSGGSGTEPPTTLSTAALTPTYQLVSAADLIDSIVQLPAGAGASRVQSPLQSANPDFSSQLATLLDQTTTRVETVVSGRIHPGLAPVAVLRALPGMTPDSVSQIITVRSALEPAEQQSPGWLLTRGLLDVAAFRRVLPELTMGGDVFQTEIVVHRPTGGPLLRRNLLLDAASAPVRRVHWIDLTDEPLPFSLQQLLPPQS